MFCRSCGTQLPDGTAFCSTCGAPTTDAQSTPEVQFVTPLINTPPSMPSTPILVFGIVALYLACTMVLSFLGIIFGAITLSKARRYLAVTGELAGKAKVGRILGKAGLIVGIIMTVVFILYIVIIVACVMDASADIYYSYDLFS